MEQLMSMKSSWWEAVKEPASRVIAILWAGFCYLVEPDAAFMAVMILVLVDLISKLCAISMSSGGLIAAVNDGKLSSKRAFLGTVTKLIAYFCLGVLTVQVRYIAAGDTAVTLSKTAVYAFLFVVEAISILENLVEAGLEPIRPILDKLKGKEH